VVRQGYTVADMDKTVKMTVTIKRGLLSQVKAMSEKDNRNLSNMVTHLIQKGMKKEKAA